MLRALLIELNEYFSSQPLVNDINKKLPKRTDNELHSINISKQEVRDVLECLNVTTACGPDLISPRLLKEGASVLAKPLLATGFNRLLLQGYFPSNWIDANVTAIHKKKIYHFLRSIGKSPYLANLVKLWKGACINICSISSVKIVFSLPFRQYSSKATQLLSSYFTHTTLF